MAILSQPVQLFDVLDTESFVRDAIKDGKVRLTPEEYEDLLGEGMLIMARLAKQYEPGRNGLDPATSRFSGFAAKYLRVKLGDAFHRMQENHRLTTQPDGTRKWAYAPKPTSLDAMTDGNPEGADHVRTLQAEDEYDSDMESTLRTALDKRWEYDRETTVKIGLILGAGYILADAVQTLRIPQEEGLEAVERIRRVAHELGVAA